MTVGDNKKAVIKGAEELANSFWDARYEFDFVAPTTTLDDALNQAFKYQENKNDNKPFHN